MKSFNQIQISQNGCWEWKGLREKRGYGHINIAGLQFGAHRLFYYLFNGRFDQSLHVCHSCDNPSCVNPEHLFLGTAKDNQQDCKAKGRLGARGQSSIWMDGECDELLKKALVMFKTQSEISKAVGVSRQAVDQWFRGVSRPGKTARLKLIAMTEKS